MKKLLVYILVLLMIPQLCFATPERNLKAVMDEYHYFLTVEWDQKDRAAFENNLTKFESEIDRLIDNGLSFNDLGNVPEELRYLSRHDRDLIKNHLMNHQTRLQGASWNGDILAPAILIGITSIAIIAFIRYAVRKNRAFDECVELHGGDEQSCIDR